MWTNRTGGLAPARTPSAERSALRAGRWLEPARPLREPRLMGPIEEYPGPFGRNGRGASGMRPPLRRACSRPTRRQPSNRLLPG